MNAPLALEEAWERLFALTPSLGGETISVDDAAGRYLFTDLTAARTQPARDLSAMDGFAVAGPGPWRVVGESRAGSPFAGRIRTGQATRISTGAACPDGTEGIVLVEDASLDGEILSATQFEPGRHIRRRGFDFVSGTSLFEAGTHIGAAQLALLRAGGHAEVTVGRRPLATIMECGDELVADPSNCPVDRLPASNGAMMAAMVRAAGSRARTIGPIADDRGELALAFSEAANADVIVTTAGASVGDHDHVRGALEDLGAELAFWRVAIRPGKPLLVARLANQIVLGLPGNPASSYVTAFLFLLPLLRAMQGAAKPLPTSLLLPLAAAVPEGCERREFLRARWDGAAVQPLPERDSSALRTLGAANLLIDRPVQAPSATAGDMVPCFLLQNGGIT